MTTKDCPQCGVSVVTRSRGPEFRCPCCDATTVELSGEKSRVGKRGDLVRRRKLDLSRFTIEKHGPKLFVRWNWSRAKGVAGLAILLVVGGLFATGMTRVSSTVFDVHEKRDWFELAFVVLPALMGFGLLHASLSCLFNRTEITFDGTQLRVWHGPIPYQRSARVATDDLDRFVIHDIVTDNESGGRDTTYELHAVRRDGRVLKLIQHEDSSTLPNAIRTLLMDHWRTLRPSEPTTRIATGRATESTPGPRITLTCPQCAAVLRPPPEHASLTCRHCGASVPVPDAVRDQLGLDPPRAIDKSQMQGTFTFRDDGGRLFFAADWDRGIPRLCYKVAAVLIAIGLAVIVLDAAFGGLSALSLFGAASAGLGIAAGYIGVCYARNRTEVVVDAETVRIWHGPLPWRNRKPLPTTGLTQFVVRRNSYWTPDDASDVRWDLLALSHYGANQTLFSEINDRAALETVEHLIERRLKIVDQAVRG